MGATSRGRRTLRRRALLVVVGLVLTFAAFAAFVLLQHGVDGVVHFFTTPTMEADSGKMYTPVTGVKRALEKLEE
jgi:hypothetical protein